MIYNKETCTTCKFGKYLGAYVYYCRKKKKKVLRTNCSKYKNWLK